MPHATPDRPADNGSGPNQQSAWSKGIPAPDYLNAQRKALLEFSLGAKTPNGFGYMDPQGVVLEEEGCALWLHSRFVHIYAVEHLYTGDKRAAELAAWGIEALRRNFWDSTYGGWHARINTGRDGTVAVLDDTKETFAHAFTMLGAASATIAGIPGARQLLDDVLDVYDRHFWEEETGLVLESLRRDFSSWEEYRGINVTMHTVEGYLAVFDALGEEKYLHRARGIADFLVNHAEGAGWRIHEHYTTSWQVDDDYNRDRPEDPFRPWGATIGHGFEWARLLIQLALTLENNGYHDGFDRLVDAAAHLYDRAAVDGWSVDGKPGFIYTTDFEGAPIVHARLHWTMSEALNTAESLRKVALRPGASDAQRRGAYSNGLDCNVERLDEDLAAWWDYTRTYMIEAPGRWHHELDADSHVTVATWPGKPDIYHAYQTLVYPQVGGSACFAKACRASSGPIGEE